jgi:hypothetical protein
MPAIAKTPSSSSATGRQPAGYEEHCSPVLRLDHLFGGRHPAASASPSVQNHRSPWFTLILVRS